jgi:hypothetical protein
MASLIKIANSEPAMCGTLLNAKVVRCPRWQQNYRLEYSEGEGTI